MVTKLQCGWLGHQRRPLPRVFSNHVIKRMYAELSSVTPRQSLLHWATNNFVFQQVPVDLVRLGLTVQEHAVTTLVTSAPFLAKRIDSWDPGLKINFSTDRTEFGMLYLWLVHWFTHSMPRTVGQTSNAGWVESRLGAQMWWTWVAVRGFPGGVQLDLCDCFLSSLQSIRAHSTSCLATM